MNRLSMWAASVALCGWLIPAVRAEDWLKRFQTEGLAQLAELEAACDNLEGEVVREFSYRTMQPRRVEFLLRMPWYRIHSYLGDELENDPLVIEKGIPRELGLGQNSRYSFRLVRKGPPVGFEVSELGRMNEAIQDTEEGIRGIGPPFFNSVHAMWKFQGRPLRSWLTKPGFTVKGVRPATHEGRTFARVEFAHTGWPPGDFSGELWLDPARHWGLWKAKWVSYYRPQPGQSLEYSYQQKERFIAEYGSPIDNFPMPKVVHVVDTYVRNDPSRPPYVEKETYTITKLIRRQAEEHEFTLSHFGIPEVIEGAAIAPRIGLWVWLLILAVVTAAVAVALRWRSWRASALPIGQGQAR